VPRATFVSSENIVMDLRAILNEEELSNVQEAIKLTEQILHAVEEKFLHIGMGVGQLFMRHRSL
jgi:Xaa-Pro aminopeptidase